MDPPLNESIARMLAELDPGDPEFATRVVDQVLALGRSRAASDLHLQPTPAGLEVKFRVDGVLQPAGAFPSLVAPNVVARLKVLAELLTYRTDVPQEGRIRAPEEDVEMRVSTFPTLHGERAVVRFFGGAKRYQRLVDLGLPDDVLDRLRRLLEETSGAILAVGPAGSGKTTTVYACLRELVGGELEIGDSGQNRQPSTLNPVPPDAAGGLGVSTPLRSLTSLEDPVEAAIQGVAQSQVDAKVGLDLATGLRFLMRQDPEVILVGEIRDRSTAEAAFQASLTGHLLLSTFHAGSAAEAIGRLSDMGIEPYVLRSGVLAILCQRLARRLCNCAETTSDPLARLGLPVESARVPTGCRACSGTGYRGRFLLVEMLTPERTELGRAILSRSDAATLERLAVEAGMVTRWQRAAQALRDGLTSPAEIRRVLGFADASIGG